MISNLFRREIDIGVFVIRVLTDIVVFVLFSSGFYEIAKILPNVGVHYQKLMVLQNDSGWEMVIEVIDHTIVWINYYENQNQYISDIC